jgi:hypothetical protein
MCVPTGHDRASIAGLLIIASELSQSRNRFASQRRRLRDGSRLGDKKRSNPSAVLTDILDRTLPKHSIATEEWGAPSNMTEHQFAQTIETYAQPFTTMLAIFTAERPTASDVITNGTGSFVHTGQKELLVTSHHVYDRFWALRQENPHAKLCMSGAHGSRFLDVSEATVLGLDEDLELAVLHVPASCVLGQGKLFYIADSWPPRRPEIGMLTALIGYPGEGRRAEGGVLGVSPLSAGLPVVSVSERHFVLVDENQDAHVLTPDGQSPLTNFGGISGSAVYAMPRNLLHPERRIELCGFVYEQSESGAICVAHADHINADGSIR